MLLACACAAPSEAERYRDALAASDWDTARRLCDSLDGTNRADCLLAAMERHGRLDTADCAIVTDALWADECTFLFAERAARAGKLDVAFDACATTHFARECSYHLIREAAGEVVEAPAAEAAKRITPYQALKGAPDAPRLFWKAWHRARVARHIPIDPDVCADDACRSSAREAVLTTLAAMSAARPGGFCESGPPSGSSTERTAWVENEVTREWVGRWVENDCARRRNPPPHAPG